MIARKLLATTVIALGFAGLASAGTLALFTDQDALGANAFTTGTIDLTLTPSTALVSFSNMMPGDTITSPLVVTNGAGSQALRYAVTAAADNTDGKNLRDQLTLTVKTGDAGTPTSCTAFSGTQLYSNDLDGGVTGRIIGDATPGDQTGDRALAVAGSETLCFRVHLPLTTGNSFKSAATTATFTFDSEQTKNN